MSWNNGTNKYDDDLFGNSFKSNEFDFDNKPKNEQYNANPSYKSVYHSSGKNKSSAKSVILIYVALVFIINIAIIVLVLQKNMPEEYNTNVERTAFRYNAQDNVVDQNGARSQVNRLSDNAEARPAHNTKKMSVSDVIQKRLRDRNSEHHGQSYSTYVMPLDLMRGDKSTDNLDDLDYFIYWDSVIWNLKTTNIPLEDKLYSESKFRMYIGSWMDYGLYHYIKENEQLFDGNDTFSLCMTMKGKTVIDDVVFYLKDKTNQNKIVSGLQIYLYQRLRDRTQKYWDDTVESVKMCYTVFHTTQDNWIKAHTIKKTDDYPNVVIKSVKWQHDSPGAVTDLAKYEDLLAQKFELIRQDIGKCVEDYENTDMTMTLNLRVSPTGGTIFVENSSSSFRQYDEAIQIDRCLELGLVLPYLMNDVGVRTEEASRVEVAFSVSPNNIKIVNVPEDNGDVVDEM